MRNTIKKLLLISKNRSKNVKICKNCNVSFDTIFEGMNIVRNNATVTGSIGYGTYIGERSVISGKVGRFCSIGSDIKMTIGTHPTERFVSTHPTFYSLLKQNGETFIDKQKFKELQYADDEGNWLVIGNDVWIGSNVTLYSGITIGDGAIIAAGAVLTKNVDPYSIVGGIPAKIIRYRFSPIQIKRLEEIKWWNKSLVWIRKNADLFEDIHMFLNEIDDQ